MLTLIAEQKKLSPISVSAILEQDRRPVGWVARIDSFWAKFCLAKFDLDVRSKSRSDTFKDMPCLYILLELQILH